MNMDEEKLLGVGRGVLRREAESILNAVERLGASFCGALRLILAHKGKMMVSGVGKSGLVGQKIAATLSSTGTPAVFMHSCDAVHGDLGVYEPGDPTLLISNSGATVECLRLIPTLRKFNSKIIALVGNLDSPMAKEADFVLDATCGSEADRLGIVPTNSTTLALAIGDALACALMEARGFSKEDFARFHPAGQLGRNLLLEVGDVMHKLSDCAMAAPDTPVRQVVIEMTGKPLGAACVLNSDGSLAGIVTDGDLRRMLRRAADLDASDCASIMSANPVTVSPGASLGDAVELMERRSSKISVLPVVDGGKCVGLIRLHDIYQPQ